MKLLLLVSISASAQIRNVKVFLDRNIRPNAEIVTKSEGIVLETKNLIEFAGILGAIKGTVISKFVGFTGLEIPIENFQSRGEAQDSIQLNILGFKASSEINTISFEIITIDDQTFSLDTSVTNSEYILDLQNFKRSIRGKLTNKSYQGEELVSFRVFIKRSRNNPNRQEGIEIEYQVDRSSLIIN